MNPAVLCGREHTAFGAVAAIAEGRCAIAISCGGARKTYRHKDPNEDAAAFVAGEGGVLVAVADGHGGCDASEVAVERLAERHAPGWTERDARGIDALWPAAARAAFADVNEAILRFAARGGAESSRTTLTFALIRPGDGLLALASMGDSHAFRVDRSRRRRPRARRRNPPRPSWADRRIRRRPSARSAWYASSASHELARCCS